MQHCDVGIDDFIHGSRIISQSCIHMQSVLWYKRALREVEKQFVHGIGARLQHGANHEDYEEGGVENDAIWIYKTLEKMKIG